MKASKQVKPVRQAQDRQPAPKPPTRAQMLRDVLYAFDHMADAGGMREFRADVRMRIRSYVDELKKPEPPTPDPKPCPECDKRRSAALTAGKTKAKGKS